MCVRSKNKIRNHFPLIKRYLVSQKQLYTNCLTYVTKHTFELLLLLNYLKNMKPRTLYVPSYNNE